MVRTVIKSLLKDSVIYGIGNAITAFYQLLLIPILSKSLSVEIFGEYNYFSSVNAIIVTIVIFGMDSAVVRFYYEKEDLVYRKQVFSNGILFQILAGILLISAYSLFSDFFYQSFKISNNQVGYFKMVLLGVPFLAFTRYFQNWFKWTFQPKKFVAITFGFVVTNIAIIFYLKFTNSLSLANVLLVNTLTQIFAAALGLLWTRKYFIFQFNSRLTRSLLIYSIPFVFMLFVSSMRSNIDRLFIKDYISEFQLGIYTFIQRLSLIVSLFTTAFDIAVGPLIFSSWNKEDAPHLFAKLQTYYLFVICSINLMINASAPLIVLVMGKSTYLQGMNVLPILSASNVIFGLLSFASIGINYSKKSIFNLITLVLAVGLMYIINFFLTPIFLQIGVAVSTLSGTFFMILLCYIFSSKFYKINFTWARDLPIFLLLTSFSFLAYRVNLFSNIVLNSLTNLLFSLVIITIVLFKYFRSDLKALPNLLKLHIKTRHF